MWSNIQSDKMGEDGEFDLNLYKHSLPRNRNKSLDPAQSESTTFKRVKRNNFYQVLMISDY